MRPAPRCLLALALAACHPSPSVSTPTEARVVIARSDATLRARVVACVPLVYSDAAPAELDRPPHVRAASGLARAAGAWVIAQDDACFLGIRRDGGEVSALALPAGEDGRRQFSDALGNKAHKPDLEALVALPDGRVLAFGSGSTARRERIAIARADLSAVDVRDAAPLYAALREAREFSGSELNVEGAVVVGDRLRLFQRGNGAVVGDVAPVSASADLDVQAFLRWLDRGGAAPPLRDVVRYDLGAVDGVPFGFTDVAALPGGRVLFAAGAEASPDTYSDGVVLGARVGVIDGDGARWAPLAGEDGAPTRLKVEGIAPDPAGLPRAWAVTDVDDPEAPALLCELSLEGPF